MIDITFDFRSDTPIGEDPDKYSQTLKAYHQLLWSKGLPNGEVMELKKGNGLYYLTWKDFDFGSDSIIVELRYERNREIIEQLRQSVGDIERFYEDLIRRSYTIGGMIIFPKHRNSMNQIRGMNAKISDRWDFTMECIRRYYKGEWSPLYKTIDNDKEFFDLFIDFRGYVDFFFLQDCVSEDYSKVNIWCGDASFERNGLPESIEDYLQFIDAEHEFLDKRNRRIQEYCAKHNL